MRSSVAVRGHGASRRFARSRGVRDRETERRVTALWSGDRLALRRACNVQSHLPSAARACRSRRLPSPVRCVLFGPEGSPVLSGAVGSTVSSQVFEVLSSLLAHRRCTQGLGAPILEPPRLPSGPRIPDPAVLSVLR